MPLVYRVCDGVSEGVIYFQVVFAPWAYGTTDRWSIWTMNVAGYVLGGLLAAKWWICWRSGYRPDRWSESREANEEVTAGEESEEARRVEPGRPSTRRRRRPSSRVFTAVLAALTVLLLVYCLIGAINARSTFVYRQMAFVPHEYIGWLPHSYDSWATWQAFWMYLGLALSFWAARDWLLGKTAKERRESRGEREGVDENRARRAPHSRLPARLQRLLWVLCVNGAVLALEGILQRLSGSDKLLWLIQPAINQWSELQFGPYAYRSNAAEYLNLLWPVCLGNWWVLRRVRRRPGSEDARVGAGPHVVLLPCAVIMAAAPIISASRGGAIIAAADMLAAFVLLMFAQRSGPWLMRLGTFFLFAVALTLAVRFGWQKLGPRLETIFSDDMSGRVEIYRNAEQMARDFPVFGTGPGTFPWIYHLYRANAQSTWAAYAHNDWLETRITFGWIGFAMVVAGLGTVWFRWIGDGGIPTHWLFVSMIWLALGGCLVHARFDFPFQIYSTLALFLQFCAILSCLSRRRSGERRAG
jgi:O-antigen ligase